MGTTVRDIRRMIEECKGSEFVLIVTDTFDYTTYAVGCFEEDFEEVYHRYNNLEQMSRVMEVYDMSLNLTEQLKESRAFHFPKGFKK